MRSLEKMVCPRNRKPFGLANQGGQRRRVEGCNCRTGFKYLIKKTVRKFPGGSVVRTPHFHYRGAVSIPGQGTDIPAHSVARKGKKKGFQESLSGIDSFRIECLRAGLRMGETSIFWRWKKSWSGKVILQEGPIAYLELAQLWCFSHPLGRDRAVVPLDSCYPWVLGEGKKR